MKQRFEDQPKGWVKLKVGQTIHEGDLAITKKATTWKAGFTALCIGHTHLKEDGNNYYRKATK